MRINNKSFIQNVIIGNQEENQLSSPNKDLGYFSDDMTEADRAVFWSGMLYNSVPLSTVNFEYENDTISNKQDSHVLSSVFTEVFVNGKKIIGEAYGLSIIRRELNGSWLESLRFQKNFKYNVNFKGKNIPSQYQNIDANGMVDINDSCFSKMLIVLGCSVNSAIEVTDISIKKTGDGLGLYFSVIIFDRDNECFFSGDAEYKAKRELLIRRNDTSSFFWKKNKDEKKAIVENYILSQVEYQTCQNYLNSISKCDELSSLLKKNNIENFWDIDNEGLFLKIMYESEEKPWCKKGKGNVYHNNGKDNGKEMVTSGDMSSFFTKLYGMPKGRMPLQRIIYGAPGTGKSYSIDSEIAKHLGIETEYKNDGKTAFEGKCKIFRTTFHPDYDYAQFVGCYKPTEGARDTNGNVTITYKFVPEVFMDAYVYAWNTGLPVYLIIEEINRGNCAQIFGDLFQLLDRNDYGESEYSIKPNTDIKNYLLSGGENDEAILMESEGIANGLRLPSNLNIIATMNTSDQSLFPMDSAFKRRWDWKYEPICYENKVNGKDKNIMIIIEDNNGEHKFKWNDFQRAVNYQILKVTSSEDKQMGDWFIKDDIRTDQFVSKVMFYLWNDVCKENYGTNDNFFRTGSDKESQFTYGTLANETLRGDTLVYFMSYLRDSFIKDDEAKKTLTQDNADSFLKEIQ